MPVTLLSFCERKQSQVVGTRVERPSTPRDHEFDRSGPRLRAASLLRPTSLNGSRFISAPGAAIIVSSSMRAKSSRYVTKSSRRAFASALEYKSDKSNSSICCLCFHWARCDSLDLHASMNSRSTLARHIRLVPGRVTSAAAPSREILSRQPNRLEQWLSRSAPRLRNFDGACEIYQTADEIALS